MANNVAIVTDTAKSVTRQTVTDYGAGVFAHTTQDYGRHNQLRVYASTPFLDESSDTAAASTLRIQLTGTNSDGSGDVVLALPINTTGTSAITGSPPIIVQQPVSITRPLNTTAQFTVTVISDISVDYQWQKNGVDMSGQNASNLVLTNIQNSDAAGYRAIATNANGSVVSNTGTLSIGEDTVTLGGDSFIDVLPHVFIFNSIF
jgi:hypothetical protein